MSSLRDSLRSAGLKSRPAKSQIVKFDGNEYEVRAPSVRQRGQILVKAGIAASAAPDKSGKPAEPKAPDMARLQVVAVIASTYAPGTDERVFEDADFDGLADSNSGDLVDALAEPALAFLNASMDKEAAKNG